MALAAYAQTNGGGKTKALSHAIDAVEDLDTTLAFYRDVFGLNGNPSDLLTRRRRC
jgi:predicted enzyme related to lactoylglutathione lyase